MRRASRVVAAVGAAAVVATAGAVLVAGRSDEPAGSDPAGARSLAGDACDAMTRFEALVQQNASVDEVREALDEAVESAAAAAAADPRWVALHGGVQSVQLAIDNDDRQAARTGIDVVRAECAG